MLSESFWQSYEIQSMIEMTGLLLMGATKQTRSGNLLKYLKQTF